MVVKIGIVGTRSRDTNKDLVKVKMEFIYLATPLYEKDDVHIVSGGCDIGGDRFAEHIAKWYKLPITIYRAQWRKYGKKAGAIRNKQIAEESGYLIACVSKDRTGGTEITIQEFVRRKGSKNLILV